MKECKMVVDIGAGPGQVQVTTVELTDAEIVQRTIDANRHAEQLAKNTEAASLPTLEQKVKLIWDAILSKDISAIEAADAAIKVFDAKYAGSK
jgi:predicted RNA methylase